jgi:hypothetical protein
MTTEQLLTLTQAARAVTGRSFHRGTLAAWRASGKLKCVLIGKRWYTTASDVQAMIQRDTDAAGKVEESTTANA